MHLETLWPPLDTIRQALQGTADDAPFQQWDRSAVDDTPHDPTAAARLDPMLADLIQRRQRARALGLDHQPWQAGWIVSVVDGSGHRLHALLDRRLRAEGVWRGWLAVAETAWAGASDVLLEPADDPFDPAAGVIQTWNPVRLREPAGRGTCMVLGRLGTARLDAVRSVAAEHESGPAWDIPSQPGTIALRTTAGGHAVLTGTPLAAQDDPRQPYRELFAERARAFSAETDAQPRSQSRREQPAARDRDSAPWWSAIRRWFASDWLVRPAFAVLCVFVIGRVLLPAAGNWDDEVRFRSTATGEPTITVRWQPGVDADSALELLAHVEGRVLAPTPDGSGWLIEVDDAAQAQQLLEHSPLVREALLP